MQYFFPLLDLSLKGIFFFFLSHPRKKQSLSWPATAVSQSFDLSLWAWRFTRKREEIWTPRQDMDVVVVLVRNEPLFLSYLKSVGKHLVERPGAGCGLLLLLLRRRGPRRRRVARPLLLREGGAGGHHGVAAGREGGQRRHAHHAERVWGGEGVKGWIP